MGARLRLCRLYALLLAIRGLRPLPTALPPANAQRAFQARRGNGFQPVVSGGFCGRGRRHGGGFGGRGRGGGEDLSAVAVGEGDGGDGVVGDDFVLDVAEVG